MRKVNKVFFSLGRNFQNTGGAQVGTGHPFGRRTVDSIFRITCIAGTNNYSLAKAIPEPSRAVLLGVGMVVLVVRRRHHGLK